MKGTSCRKQPQPLPGANTSSGLRTLIVVVEQAFTAIQHVKNEVFMSFKASHHKLPFGEIAYSSKPLTNVRYATLNQSQ
ncbi:MAG: hypothetical protein EA349_07000 [Halomonadaceae bacterium]|nr:MAG: hypothetical protein EA349_07000 [Halomonadaceae bacterium]